MARTKERRATGTTCETLTRSPAPKTIISREPYYYIESLNAGTKFRPATRDPKYQSFSVTKLMVADSEEVGEDTTSNPIGFLHQQSLNCYYHNAQGRRGKFPELNLRFISGQWDIVDVTEIRLAAGISDSALSLSEMSLLRCDCPTRGGGGVLLYHRNNLDCGQIQPRVSTPDTLWCRVSLSKQDDCLIGVIYRPPSSPKSAHMTLLNSMLHILAKRFTPVLLMGDINCSNLDEPMTSHCLFEQHFMKLIASQPLYNHVKEHTGFGNLQSPYTLDLMLTSEELMIESVAIQPPGTQ
ncbi:unnamed protein product [Echinostoma caproni]|uniref:Endo/exonuclease/phosphatase domain-containing protein n=1 Tax=Echinostoma caproni TaxID=27848 RepID=A0A183A5Y2_9TREM|nr:unnamed protein product [Echinostoma caproni]